MTALVGRGQFTGSMLVAEHGKIIYHKAWGLANQESNKPYTVSTTGYIGSITKQFTAAGIMILQEKGKLTYNQSIRQFFPELPACMQPVTIRHLLHHVSGLAVFDDFPDMTETDVFNILLEQTALRFAPGERFEYCNAGYTLLGMIISKVSGQSLNDFLVKHVFRPLGMKRTSMNEKKSRNTARATGYDMFGTLNNYDTFIGGSASLISTTGDLFKWDQALYNPTFIKRSTLAEAFKKSPHLLKDDQFGDKSYGFGWWIGEHNGSMNLFHDGAFGGYRAYIERFIGNKNTIIHISNLRHPFLLEIRKGIVNILDGKPYELPKIAIGAWLYRQIQAKGIADAIAEYKKIRLGTGSDDYMFRESELNSLGYYLLRQGRPQESLQVFILNTEEYPQSGNTFDSLGEAYMKAGNKAEAIKNYKKSLELDPGNGNAADMIKKLEQQQ